jgi:CheY-like chemotaxis protein
VTRQRQAEAELRESDRRKDVFIATLAHELRNPLAPVRSGLDLLQMTRASSDEDQTVLDMMGRQLSHMVRLIDDLLDIGRINTGKVTLCRKIVTLDEIVRDAVAAAKPQLDAAGHELVFDLPLLPVTLNADPDRLAQVLTNLLNNSAKFTPSPGRVSLAARMRDRQLEIEVRDPGIGINDDALPHIFTMFSQAENLHVRTHGGLGIGLSIVKAFVEMHGGTVEAFSDGNGRGSRFVVQLPCLTSTVLSPSANGKPHHEGNGRTHVPRVLVVDDNQDAARMLAATLRHYGYECREAFDGAEALKEAKGFEPEVFILDLGMPGMSGYELARALRVDERFANAMLIAATGWDKEEDRRQSRLAGFDHHLAKPVDVQTIKRLMSSIEKATPPVITHREERLI